MELGASITLQTGKLKRNTKNRTCLAFCLVLRFKRILIIFKGHLHLDHQILQCEDGRE